MDAVQRSDYGGSRPSSRGAVWSPPTAPGRSVTPHGDAYDQHVAHRMQSNVTHLQAPPPPPPSMPAGPKQFASLLFEADHSGGSSRGLQLFAERRERDDQWTTDPSDVIGACASMSTTGTCAVQTP